MTRNIHTLYNAISTDPNAMAALGLAESTGQRTALLVTMGRTWGLPVSAHEARVFLESEKAPAA